MEDKVQIDKKLVNNILHIFSELEHTEEIEGYKGHSDFVCKICYEKYHDSDCELINIIRQLQNINDGE